MLRPVGTMVTRAAIDWFRAPWDLVRMANTSGAGLGKPRFSSGGEGVGIMWRSLAWDRIGSVSDGRFDGIRIFEWFSVNDIDTIMCRFTIEWE